MNDNLINVDTDKCLKDISEILWTNSDDEENEKYWRGQAFAMTTTVLRFWEKMAERYPDVFLKEFKQENFNKLFSLEKLERQADLLPNERLITYLQTIKVYPADKKIMESNHNWLVDTLQQELRSEADQQVIQRWMDGVLGNARQNSLQHNVPTAIKSANQRQPL